MSTLLDQATGLGRSPAGELPPSPFGAPVLAALRAAAGSLVPVLVPVVLAWVLGAGGEATWLQVVRLAIGLWLLGHHAGLAVAGGNVGLVPLGLAAAPLLSCWYAGRRLARTMDPQAERIAAGATRARPAMPSRPVLATFCLAYAAIAGLAAAATAGSGTGAVVWQAVLGAAVVGGVGGGLGAAAHRYVGPVPGLLAVVRLLPDQVLPLLRPALAAVAAQCLAGLLLVLALIGFGASRVTALHQALDPGAVGGVVLTLGELLLLPNLALWACAVMAGPGFAIGAGTSVTLGTTTLGPLPAIPVLAALPTPGGAPGAAWALLAVPVLSGVLAGLMIARQQPRPRLLDRLGRAAGSALVAGLLAGVLSWLSGGPAGPGRMSAVGPQPLLTAAAVAAEVALGALAAVLLAAALPGLADLRLPAVGRRSDLGRITRLWHRG